MTPGQQNQPNTVPGAQYFRQNLGEMSPYLHDNAVDRRLTRWFFYAGDEPGHVAPGGLSVQNPCIPDGIIRRCLVTPCITTTRQARHTDKFSDIIDGNMVPGSQYERPGYAREWIWAGEAATEITEQYASPTRVENQWGLVELTALQGIEFEEVLRNFNVTSMFFPEWPHDVPESNGELTALIKEKAAELKLHLNEKNREKTEIYLKCAEQMLHAVGQAQYRHEALAKTANIRITLPDTHKEHKERFDPMDFLAAKRSGIALAEDASKGNPASANNKLIEALSKQTAIDPNLIASIVSATMAAMREESRKAETPAKKA